ncbi:hypothetical protein OHR68_14725 [Spirillospora sp. NBC_00431]
MTETEKALRAALRARGESYPVSPDAWSRVRERAAARRARRRRTVPAVAAAATAGVAAAVLAPALLGGGGDDARPPAAVAATPREVTDQHVAEVFPRLCDRGLPAHERRRLLPPAGALPTFNGGWIVAVGDGTGGLRLIGVMGVEGRLSCRPFAAAPDGGRTFIAYGGERGRGEVSWTGVTAPEAAAFEARYEDGTRLRFACGGETAGCVRRATVKGRLMVFTTKPRMYTPPKAGAPLHGTFTVFDAEGKVLERRPFST